MVRQDGARAPAGPVKGPSGGPVPLSCVAVAFSRQKPPLPRKGLLGLLVVAAGCVARETHAEYPRDLYHPDYVRRSKAVAEFAERGDKSQLPQAFELLLDDDAHIRLVAYEAIREMSPGAEDFGYRAYLPQDVRFGIVVRWQAWWVKGGGATPEAAGEAGEATPSAPPLEAAHG